MFARASIFNALVGIAVDVVRLSMALLSFRGFDTPSLPAQGEQRRSSFFNIRRDIGHTERWGTQVTAVEIKDIVLPDNMQRAMAKEAEAERERRAKIVAAEGEYQAAVKLGQAADIITQHPVALQLRTLQTMAEISIEKNSTIIFPAQFMTTVQEALAMVTKDSESK